MTERDRIRAILAFALRHRAPGLKWKRHDDASADAVAGAVLAHLELSNVRLGMRPPMARHSTPAGRETDR